MLPQICLIPLGPGSEVISRAPFFFFNLTKGRMDLPHFYDFFSKLFKTTTDSRPYDCPLIIWYLPIGVTLLVADVSVADAVYIPLLHHLPIHSIHVWWNEKERVIAIIKMVPCCIPDCRYSPLESYSLPP